MTQDSHLRLRPPVPSDIDIMYDCERDDSTGISRQACRNFVLHSHHDLYLDGQLRLMLEDLDTHQLAGIIDLFDYVSHARTAQIGIYIRPAYRRRGMALRAIGLLSEHVFRYLAIDELLAQVEADNTASSRLFLKAGFAQKEPNTSEVKMLLFNKFNPARV